MAKVPSEFRNSFGGVENSKIQISAVLPLDFVARLPRRTGYSKPFAHSARAIRKTVR
jgi:hypothetical protein